jgi:hypothetical protein
MGSRRKPRLTYFKLRISIEESERELLTTADSSEKQRELDLVSCGFRGERRNGAPSVILSRHPTLGS